MLRVVRDAGRRFAGAFVVGEEGRARSGLRDRAQHPSDWVIGGDSVISLEGRRFLKPASREDAAENLRFFSGRPMRLVSAVAGEPGPDVFASLGVVRGCGGEPVRPGGRTGAEPSMERLGTDAEAIRFSTLEAICKALDCQPGDILEYRNDEKPE